MASLNDNTISTAQDLGVLSNARDITDTFDSTDRVAFYKFTLSQNSDLSLLINGTSLRATLIADIDGNGIIDDSEAVGIDRTSENLFKVLPAGTYFIQLQTFGNSENQYDLRLAQTPKPGNVSSDPGNTLSQALDLEVLSGQRSLKDYVGELDEIDFYRFTLTQNSNLGIDNAEGSSVPISIIADRNENGVVDQDEVVADGSNGFGSDLSVDLSAGTYFIQVGQTLGSTAAAQYDLALTQINSGENNSPPLPPPNPNGKNRLTGTPRRDVIRGLGSNDRILGRGGSDRLIGNAGNDRLVGGVGRDRLEGQGGNDVLQGGGDEDVLIGGAGNDVITTELGRDRIVLRRGQGFDRVTDFRNNQDKIDLISISFEQLTLQQRQNDVLVKLGGGNLILIEDTNLRAVNQADFV